MIQPRRELLIVVWARLIATCTRKCKPGAAAKDSEIRGEVGGEKHFAGREPGTDGNHVGVPECITRRVGDHARLDAGTKTQTESEHHAQSQSQKPCAHNGLPTI